MPPSGPTSVPAKPVAGTCSPRPTGCCSKPPRFATIFYAMYDAATLKLTYANAGHCPPILVREETPIRLESLTPRLGILPELAEIEREVQLVPGDWLLVFSDGVTEAADEKGAEFGEEGLLLAFYRACTRGAAEASAVVIGEVRNHFTGAAPAG